ncbi:hypothetical protein [Piscinibacter defluvii]|uniref:hypothetical protein n=1 Tax=Piscinibacter defluvii TaxID=1796922 RepID=UPI000FDD6893|nr:hypothetical protein [Piscinibacter defluvii]
MDPPELDVLKISQRFLVIAMQAVAAYEQAQRQLDLAHVLDADRLVSPEGIAQSRQTLEQLSALTAQHKEYFAKFITGSTEQLLAAVNELPEDRRQSITEGLMRSINYNLAEQSRFYAGRERWVAAGLSIFNLAEEHAGQIWLEQGELVFGTTALLEAVQALSEEMEQVHQAEVALQAERQAHIARAMARMSPKV